MVKMQETGKGRSWPIWYSTSAFVWTDWV